MAEIFVFWIGAVLGSFFGLIIDRLTTGESIVVGRSHCQSCGKVLTVRDLIPILSQLLSRSHCRYCQVKIPYWYGGIEFLTGILFLLTWSNLITLTTSLLFLMSLLLSIFDWRYHEFPFLIWLVFSFIIFLLVPFQPLGCIYLLLAFLSEKFNLKIGSGDLLWLFTASLTMDLISVIIVLQIASLTGIVQFLLTKEKGEIAFIPHLTAASLILWAVHQTL